MDSATVVEATLNGSIEESGKREQRRFHRANGQKFGTACAALLLTQLFSFPSSAYPVECKLGDEAASEIAITISLFGNGEFEKFFESIHESIRVLPEDSAETISKLKEMAPAGFQSCDLISRVELKPSYIKDVFAFSTNDSDIIFLRVDSANIGGKRVVLYYLMSSQGVDVFSD